jgi:3-oxoadipate enol-lactonase
MLAFERSGPSGSTPILLVHAGICDRTMWDPVWPALTAGHDVVRVDLRGYGESADRPDGTWSPRADVLAVLDDHGISRAHLVGCSFGAGVCAEVALERPEMAASLVLAAPGGALLTERTDELAAAWELEGAAIDASDIAAAVDANVVAWVDGPHRGPDEVAPAVRDAVRVMQQRNFDITLDWPDSVWEAEDELDPEASGRLGEIAAPTLVVSGAQDIDSVAMAADAVAAQIPGAELVVWPDVAHLPSMERPDDFAALVLDRVARADG